MAVAMFAPAPAPAATLRAALYLRVSTTEQAEHGTSLDSQDHDTRRLAAELSAPVVAVYSDTGSGTSWDLDGLNRLLDDAKRHAFDLVLCLHPDRLSRSMGKALVVEEELKRAGIGVRYVALPHSDDSPESQLQRNMLAMLAEYDRQRIIFRTTRGRRAKAEAGKPVGSGGVPFGFLAVKDDHGRPVAYALDPVRAPIVAQLFADVARMPLADVAARLNAAGIPSARGGRWTPSGILDICCNPAMVGQYVYGRTAPRLSHTPRTGTVVAVPAIVDRATWDAAHAALERRRVVRRARVRGADPYLLRGVLTCAHCGGPLAVDKRRAHRYYLCLRSLPHRAADQGCAVCSTRRVPADAAERWAWDVVTRTLLDPGTLAAGLATAEAAHAVTGERRQHALAAVDQEIARLRARYDRIVGERLDAAPGSEAERALRRQSDETEATIRRLLADRAALAAEPQPGLSPEEGQALTTFASGVRTGIDVAQPADQRRVFELLRLTGTVRRDPAHGIRLGRFERFSVDWEAVLPLAPGGYGDKTSLKVSMPAQATRTGGRGSPGGSRR